jgi:hypothetical protein
MARYKTIARKQVSKVWSRRHLEINLMLERPLESHDEWRTVGYFLRELRSCHTPFQDSRNEASIRVPRMSNSHV